MRKWEIENLKSLRASHPTYRDMIKYCGDNLILNNDIIPTLRALGIEFDTYCGDELFYLNAEGDELTFEEYCEALNNGEDVSETFEDIYQYYIITGNAAEYLARYTNEIVYYCEKLDLYLLGVTHFGTSWDYVPANWKDPEQEAAKGVDDDNE